MKEKIEFKGYWWIPSNPKVKLAGTLKYIPNQKIILELIGDLDSDKNPITALLDYNTENIIHGFTSDSKEITLVNCYPSGSVNFSCFFPIIRYSCKLMLIGKHIHSFNQKCFYKALITIPELTYWRPPNSLDTSIKSNDKDRVELISLSFEIASKIIDDTQIDNNTRLIIKGGVDYNQNQSSAKIEQKTSLEIHKDSDVSFEDFLSDIYMFEEFLSLATLQTTKSTRILLFDKTIFQELEKDEKYYHAIEIIYIQNSTESSDLNNHNFLFSYGSIASQYSQVIQKWYRDKDEIAPIRTHLIDSIKGKQSFSSIDFLIVIQAIEGFWWRFRDENYKRVNKSSSKYKTNLKTILHELINEFNSIGKIKVLDLDIQSIVDSRHYYSHFMSKANKPYALDGFELYYSTNKLRNILICCVLHFIGFEYLQIDEILNHTRNNLLTKHD